MILHSSQILKYKILIVEFSHFGKWNNKEQNLVFQIQKFDTS